MNYRDLELQELAGAALGMSEQLVDDIINDDGDFDELLLEKFGVDFEQFSYVAEALLKLTPVLESPSGEIDHCFVRRLKNGGYLAIIKSPANK